MIPRLVTERLLQSLRESRVTFLTGPRQSGKSTLARALARGPWPATYATLDDAATRAVAQIDPEGYLRGLPGPAVIDEVQRVPDLLLAIKRIVDEDTRPGRFLLTGSADVLALPRVSDALVGRMQLVPLWPLAERELAGQSGSIVDLLFLGDLTRLPTVEASRSDLIDRLLRGGFPEAIARPSAASRTDWFESYTDTIILREILSLARLHAADELPSLFALLAGNVGGLLNVSGLAGNLRMSEDTVRRYVSLLETVYIVRRIPAWMPRVEARTVKAPKLYYSDTGLALYALGMEAGQLNTDPKWLGRMTENFVGMELIKQATWSSVRLRQFHWRSSGGAEVDQVLEARGGRVVAVEVKSSMTLRTTDHSHLAKLRDQVGSKFVAGVLLYVGERTLPLGDRLWAVPIATLWS